jgi:hypothetical protein
MTRECNADDDVTERNENTGRSDDGAKLDGLDGHCGWLDKNDVASLCEARKENDEHGMAIGAFVLSSGKRVLIANKVDVRSLFDEERVSIAQRIAR